MMKRYLIPSLLLLAYSAMLIKVMVFKDFPMIRMGQLMLNFGGTNAGDAANFVPLKTILPYLFGHKGLLIAGINLVGNVALLVPIGFLLPFLYRSMTWKMSVLIGVAVGLAIEVTQTALKVGIFDIDDVILNALGVVIGYLTFFILSKWLAERKYIHILATSALVIAAALATFYYIYPHGEPVVNPGMRERADQVVLPEGGDLCGGTGGNGEIVSLGDNSFTLQLNNGNEQIINLVSGAEINTSADPSSPSVLKIGDRVTLVGGPNPDGTFTAEAVFVCGT
jgi:glycopeptide antibiotics resistance protein